MYLGCLGIRHRTHTGNSPPRGCLGRIQIPMQFLGSGAGCMDTSTSLQGGKFSWAGPGWPRVQELGIVSKGSFWVREAGACVILGTCVYVGSGRSMSWAIRWLGTHLHVHVSGQQMAEPWWQCSDYDGAISALDWLGNPGQATSEPRLPHRWHEADNSTCLIELSSALSIWRSWLRVSVIIVIVMLPWWLRQ